MKPVHEHESTLLNPGAEYGNLPFDQFVLTNWDVDKAEENDQEQWNDLASRWLSMNHINRSEMFECGQADFGPEIVLEDESLYGQYGHDWTRVFLRLPQLIDIVVHYNDGHPENDESQLAVSPPNDEARLPLYNAVMKSKSIHFLFDEEALQEKLVKVHFLDIHGQSVWYNKIRPEHIRDFEASPSGGHLSGHLENCGGDPSSLHPGTLLYAEGWNIVPIIRVQRTTL
ncbi:hypothetical protein COCVIDRAFT_31535 [Bipolaris victoriae FI3]|uniref:Uncharacterized protein n=1 Tax=Bipolaris victoriae (strain FI3) TaxID=930091 RepID=W7EAV1_BIPV3|nr:hypothetical protein COCVIDRAFT_31535 [Bipolaris victoriae FI3]